MKQDFAEFVYKLTKYIHFGSFLWKLHNVSTSSRSLGHVIYFAGNAQEAGAGGRSKEIT